MRFVTKITCSNARLALAAALPLVLAACAATGPTPEPEATLLAAPWTSVPPTAEPTVDAAASATKTPMADVASGASTATMDVVAFATQLSATIAALASPAPTTAPRVAVNTAVPIAGCAVPKRPLGSSVHITGDAPEGIRAWWSADGTAPHAFDGEVMAGDAGGFVTRVRATHDGAEFEAFITTDVPLTLEPGRRVRVAWHNIGGGDDGGFALLVTDEAGLVAHVLTRGLRLPAAEPLLGGDRGGWTIEQLRSPCVTPERACGVALFAAPVLFTFGSASLTLGPGDSGVLLVPDGGPSFDVHVATSHIAVAEGSAPCPGWSTWPLSYRIVRR